MSKGSKDRTKNRKEFNENYSNIDWETRIEVCVHWDNGWCYLGGNEMKPCCGFKNCKDCQ